MGKRVKLSFLFRLAKFHLCSIQGIEAFLNDKEEENEVVIDIILI